MKKLQTYLLRDVLLSGELKITSIINFIFFIILFFTSISLLASETYKHSKNLALRQNVVQQTTISGTVSDESGQPLPGVSVIVKGTNKGTITDFDGNYSLT